MNYKCKSHCTLQYFNHKPIADIYCVGIDKINYAFPLLYFSLIPVATSYTWLLSAKAYKLLSASSHLNNYTARLTHQYTSSETVLSRVDMLGILYLYIATTYSHQLHSQLQTNTSIHINKNTFWGIPVRVDVSLVYVQC